MKAKKTLKYFREVHKTPELSGLILHWYRLEESLGFPDVVSAPTIQTTGKFPNVSQTPKGFPLGNRPKVVSAFYKNGHNYRKDYELEAKTLGADIIAWWDEIKASNLYFGGPTGTYTLIVLVTWWGLLLKGRPNGDTSDYLRTLDDIDRTILSVVDSRKTPPGKSTPRMPMVAETPQPRGSKRAASDEGTSRKRLRAGGV